MLDDSLLVIRKEKVEETKKSEQSGQVFNILIQYISRMKLKAQIDRNLLLAKKLSSKFDATLLFKGDQEAKSVRTQNIVRFFEKAMKTQKQLNAIEKDSLDPAVDLWN